MKKDFETKFTGWALITAAIFLLFGWVLSPHHTGEYLVVEDFEAISQNVWYWIWMFRVHIFGWVIMGAAMMAFAVMAFDNPHRILLVPGAGVVIVGSFTTALAFAFYYTYGAWGIGQTDGKSPEEILQFTSMVTVVNQYATCFLRFGRIFSGLGLLIFGVGIMKSKIIDSWIGAVTALYGMAVLCLILFIPLNYEVYKPLFYFKTLWLALVGVMLLQKGVNSAKLES